MQHWQIDYNQSAMQVVLWGLVPCTRFSCNYDSKCLDVSVKEDTSMWCSYAKPFFLKYCFIL